ncbi:metallophosphoesterase [Elongatibacter sediminis]|uniref:Metallophosphoesterase n=1 Tax=Elongatibacter sediminis TaxID=3119006 RepID=A0AAW9RF78_9GAMM
MPTAATTAPVRLVQISDCHLPARPGTPYRGGNADDGLLSLVSKVAGRTPDALLLTGDLSEDSSAEAYRRLRAALDPLELPLLALPGNHDRPSDVEAYFANGPWNGPLAQALGGWRIVMLDSTLEGRVEGRLTDDTMVNLEAELARNENSWVLLALHHQPVPVGSRWIDRYRLLDPEPLLDLIEDHPRVRCVVWGHVHQAFESRHGQARLLACPSTAANSLPGQERFTPDPAGPACRWLELHSDGSVRTGLLRA